MKNLVARALRKAARIIDPEKPIKQLEEDDYLLFLRYLIPGILERGNIYAFDHAIASLPSNAPILEIGSFCGLSAAIINYLARRRGLSNPLVTCDKWIFQKPTVPTTHVGPISYCALEQFASESYIRNMHMFCGGNLPFTVQMFSDEFFEAWEKNLKVEDVFGRTLPLGGTFSFCFIDGNHTYEFAKNDFVNCDRYLEVGGFILFDDSTLLKDDVCLVMPEVLATKRYELVMMNPYHLFRKTHPAVTPTSPQTHS